MAMHTQESVVDAMKRNHPSECSGCDCEEQVFLSHFHFHERGTYQRLCADCVLKKRSGYFCAICFEIYDRLPPVGERLMCVDCLAISHLSCVGSNFTRLYKCPPCANPNFTFFNPRGSSEKKNIEGSDGGESAKTESSSRAIDKDSVKQLLATAKLSLASMDKAASVARVEVQKRVKEAVAARKMAKEAVERIA
ncbi:uncharacterized protein LOC132289011 [Cornus florida]|uniref:uncharacterized protein LOC132289011 n=1 Tax=Cornus florida TaxID=4283 RepID=UPI00289F67B1|nr:uncharacterized protein LOC132289011 [Cornus florida]